MGPMDSPVFPFAPLDDLVDTPQHGTFPAHPPRPHLDLTWQPALKVHRSLTMPFSSRYTRSRARTGRGRFGRNRKLARAGSRASLRGPVGTTHRRAPSGIREMPLHAPMSTARPEMKFVDVDSATYVANTTGTVTFLNSIAPGALIEAGREGSRVQLQGTQIRGRLTAGTTGTIAKATLVLVWDRQTNGAAPVITNVYETINSNSFQLTATRDRFHILGRWDYIIIGNSTTPTVGRESLNIDQKVVYSRLSQYGEASGAITDMLSGGLFMLTFGDTAAGTTAPNFVLQVRTYYGDN